MVPTSLYAYDASVGGFVMVYASDDALHVKVTDDAGTTISPEGVTGTLCTTQLIESALTVLATPGGVQVIDCSDLASIYVRILVASVAITEFQILAGDGTNYDLMYSTTADYTSPEGLLIGTQTFDAAGAVSTGDLSNIVASGIGWFVMDVMGLNAVQLKANGANSVVTVTYSGR